MIRRPPISPLLHSSSLFLFFFNDTATTEIYTLSLHDALPISQEPQAKHFHGGASRVGSGNLAHVREQCQSTEQFHAEGGGNKRGAPGKRSEEHTSELQSLTNLVCRLLLEIGRAHV